MKAFQVKEHLHPSKIQISDDVPLPKCGNEDILVEVYSAGLNFFDILQSQGKYQNQPPLPFVLGSEFAGRVALNSHIPVDCPFRPGDRVLGAAQGAFGEVVNADWRSCIPVPKEMTWEQASGIYVTYPTSYEALVGRAQTKAGEWVLVHAAAGGVGMAAVQIAKALGCKVIATASTEEKRRICKEKGGADFTIDYTQTGWQQQVMKITGGHGADVVYDPVGLLVPSLKCIAWKGRLLVVGFAAGQIEKVPANLVLLKNVSIVGVHWGATARKEPPHVKTVWHDLLALFSSRKLVPLVYDKVYDGLNAISEGLHDLETRKTWGKAVVRVRNEDGKPSGKAADGVLSKDAIRPGPNAKLPAKL
ncbi:hypothetical protein NCC49_005524 [Naganishia albida]|nr:hypothetical protein NCC49_005524 [Naganishia albida]